jgi:hypothetical protein
VMNMEVDRSLTSLSILVVLLAGQMLSPYYTVPGQSDEE